MNNIEKISNFTVERYSKRFEKHGYGVKTLGRGSVEQQNYRFEQVLAEINPEKNFLLDIGCGFGDLLSFFYKNNKKPMFYRGLDINENILNKAREIHQNKINFDFVKQDIAKNNIKKDNFDIGITLGLLNFNLKKEFDNYEYSKIMIKNAFNLVDKLLIVDFLSTKLTTSYPKEDFVFYHDPAQMLNFAFELSNNVVLKHNYAPIPQKEFMLFIYKD